MKFLHAILILIQLVAALLFRNERKTAYLLYLWRNLSDHKVQAGSQSVKLSGVPNEKETKSPARKGGYSLFLEP